MKQKLEAFLRSDQFRELFLYLVIGVLTTVVSYVTYVAAAGLIGLVRGQAEVDVLTANIATVIQHVVAIAFAFVTNKRFVFRTPGWKGPAFWREAWTFATARLLSVFLDMGFMSLAVGPLGMNDKVAKMISQVVIVLVNYFASKFWIFRKDESK